MKRGDRSRPCISEDGGLFVSLGFFVVVKVEASHSEKNPNESIEN